MKRSGNKIFFLLLAVFLALTFMYQYFTPKKFVWTETYSRHDRQPFGSYVFDDVVSSSVSDYRVMDKTFYQYYYDQTYGDAMEDVSLMEEKEYGGSGENEYPEEDDEYAGEEYEPEEEEYDGYGEYDCDYYVAPLPPEKRRAFLVVNHSIFFSDEDLTALMYLLRQGNKVMFCLERFPYALCDSLYFRDASRTHSAIVTTFEQYAARGYRRDSLISGTDALHPDHVCEVYPHMHLRILQQGVPYYDSDTTGRKSRILCDSLEALARNGDGDTVALRLFIGEGELFLVSTPLMFTNYGILDGGNASYAFRLLSYMNGMPLIRLGIYNNDSRSASPLRYVLGESSLRWTLYASLATIILFMIFTAKRRQRIIPVVQPPANETLRFTRLIANLYYQRKDYKDLLRKKYLYFCAELKRTEGLDLQSDERDEELGRRLAEKMRQEYASVWPAFRELKYLLRDETEVDEKDMIRQINRMNEWTEFLK
ncbi:MAG: hypothetical protein LBS42_03385 [Tannerella sp.]|jgi:hypothetical protein|nr:hypothetical protein [Tannerella sp.]